MSPFAIFAIVLTILYVLYYGIVISKDLYSKKGQDNETKEDIEVPAPSDNDEEKADEEEREAGREKMDESPISVIEKGDGFIVGTESEKEPVPGEEWRDEESDASEKRTGTEDSSQANAQAASETFEPGKSDAEKIVDRLNESMLQADVESDGGIDAKELEDHMIAQQVNLFRDSTPQMRIKATSLSDATPTSGATEALTPPKNGSEETEHKEADYVESERKEAAIRDAI